MGHNPLVEDVAISAFIIGAGLTAIGVTLLLVGLLIYIAFEISIIVALWSLTGLGIVLLLGSTVLLFWNGVNMD